MRTAGGPDPYQCVVVGGGVPFWFGGTFKGWAGGYIYARFYANKTCSGESFDSLVMERPQYSDENGERWLPQSTNATTPPGTQSVSYSVSVSYLLCDQLFFNTSANSF